MKKAIPLLIAIVILGVIFGISINYKNKIVQNTLESTSDAPSSNNNDRELTEDDIIAKTDDGLYKLYYKNDIAAITYKDASLNIYSIGKSIELETPVFYYHDFDKDGKKDLIIRMIDNYDASIKKDFNTYTLVFVKPIEQDDGSFVITTFSANAKLWKTTFKNAVKEQMSQLKNTNKFIQYVMTNPTSAIEYDENTGISTNKYVGFAKADCDEAKNYYNVTGYYKGLGDYNIDENGKISLEIQLFVNYKETENPVQIGNLHCTLGIDVDHFYIEQNSISFVPLDGYEITDPRNTAKEDWSYPIENQSSSNSNDKVINSFKAELDISENLDSDKYYFHLMEGELANVESIDFTQSDVTLTPKKGFSFDEEQLKSGKFAVTDINDMDISDGASINNGRLIINFDKAYSKYELEKVTVTFG